MKKASLLALIFALICIFSFSACDSASNQQTAANTSAHIHKFEEWIQVNKPTCVSAGTNERYCSCGEAQTQTIAALGHDEVIDAAVAATCTADGKTEGKHCSRCGETLVAQTILSQLGHVEVVDAAVAATCTTDGKTEGKHCSRCGETLVAQTILSKLGHVEVVDAAVAATCTADGKTEGMHCSRCNAVLVAPAVVFASGHQYNNGEITTPATCTQNGVKTFTCTVANCRHSYTESYALPTYTATELYNLSIQYVGEIVTYDKSGTGLALGTGFVISSDGKIVTNYHVIEGAYSAEITINGQTYQIVTVLAYDATIDLAVVKINATGLAHATVCKQPVSVGSTVYAIGSSRGMTNTYSQGIVTYANRVVDGVSHIQHDASITNGNSGGPLLNTYGEVIGINTWTLTDSQNLNFAVSAGELDNLTYGTPITLAELYLRECNVFERLKNYIIDKGTYDSEDNYYYVRLGTSYSSDYSSKYTRIAYYYVDDNEITLDFLIDDGEYWVYFEIDENVDGSYAWHYFDDYDLEMSGTLYASTYDNNTLLGYSYNNISSASLRQSVRELSSEMIAFLCLYIDTDFSSINVTAEDLGFYYY